MIRYDRRRLVLLLFACGIYAAAANKDVVPDDAVAAITQRPHKPPFHALIIVAMVLLKVIFSALVFTLFVPGLRYISLFGLALVAILDGVATGQFVHYKHDWTRMYPKPQDPMLTEMEQVLRKRLGSDAFDTLSDPRICNDPSVAPLAELDTLLSPPQNEQDRVKDDKVVQSI